MDTNEVMTGTVIFVNRNRGFCFIRGHDGYDRFGHVRNFIDQKEFDILYDGQRVEFIPMDLNRTEEAIRGNGLRATKIKAI